MTKPLSHLHVCSWLIKNIYLYPQLHDVDKNRIFSHLPSLTLQEIINQTIKTLKNQILTQMEAQNAVFVPNFGYFFIIDGLFTFKIHQNLSSFVMIQKYDIEDKEIQKIDISQISGKIYLSSKTVHAIISAYCRAMLDLASNGKKVLISFGVCQVGLENGKVQVKNRKLAKKQQKTSTKKITQRKYHEVWMSSLEGGLGGRLNAKQIEQHLENGVRVTKKYINKRID